MEGLKKENASLRNVAGKLKAAQQEIERLREAWTDKDVKLAEANNAANSQRHVSRLTHKSMQNTDACPDHSRHALQISIHSCECEMTHTM